MTIEHHEIGHDFPEYKDAIHELKMHNAHFKRLYDEHHQLDREIYRFESKVETTTDEHLEDLKKTRLKLTDEIYTMLKDYSDKAPA